MALFAIGAAGGWSGWATGASAKSLTPTPTHLVVGPRIDIPSELRWSTPPAHPGWLPRSQASEVAVSMWQLWEGALFTRDTTALDPADISPGPLSGGG